MKLLHNMYIKIGARVKVNHRLYDLIDDSCGTNQGGPLSPNIFRCMLSDHSKYIDSNFASVLDDDMVAHMLWADDLVLFADLLEEVKKTTGSVIHLLFQISDDHE